jgi:hypothetical protein
MKGSFCHLSRLNATLSVLLINGCNMDLDQHLDEDRQVGDIDRFSTDMHSQRFGKKRAWNFAWSW